MISRDEVYIVTGPTASGKSSLAMDLAIHCSAEIISADSMQVYRGLDIGTAKPTVADRSRVPHHLIDICDPWERYTVAEWLDACRLAIADIQSRGKTAVICGGTGLYIKALVEGLDFAATEEDSNLRTELEARLAERGAEAMHTELRLIDPEAAERIHPNNKKRVIRALEINYESGMYVAAYHEVSKQSEIDQRFKVFMLNHPRERLYQRVNARVDQMVEEGILEEARYVMGLDLPADATCLQAIGYKEFFPYLLGESSLEACIDLLKMSTRRYAKRQLTFFRPVDWVQEILVDEADDAGSLLERLLSY